MQDNTHSLIKPIKILYEDDCFIVFEKPAGLLVISTPKKERNTLVNIVNYQYSVRPRPEGQSESKKISGSTGKLHPCHRLDKETSGIIMFAKGKRNQQLMMGAFKKREVRKGYVAFIHGRLKKRRGEFRGAICNLDGKKFRRNSIPKSAITCYKVVEERKLFSIVEVRPVTGRTNQIRIHFSENGHPLVGDRKYAHPRDYYLKFRRAALHAFILEWRHPVSNRKIKVESVLPKDMEAFIANNTD